MSFATTYLLDRNFAERFEAHRRGRTEDPRPERLTVRIALRRRNRNCGRHWDPTWRTSLRRAAEELGIEAVARNGGLFVADEEQRHRLVTRAEQLSADVETLICRRTDPARL